MNGLKRELRALPKMAVAFSGGLDSRFLCHAALLSGSDVIAIHATGPHFASEDSRFAQEWAAARGLPLLMVEFDPLPIKEVEEGTRQRCYACKKALIAAIRKKLADCGENGRILCDGGNADDRNGYRPGMKAVAESGVLSPLASANLGKKDIRRLARMYGLDMPDQKARPCLLTRFDYGIHPDKTQLQSLAGAEMELGRLLAANGRGKEDFRLRLLPEPVLHMQSPLYNLEEQVASILQKYGFHKFSIEILPEGVGGFFDRTRTALN